MIISLSSLYRKSSVHALALRIRHKQHYRVGALTMSAGRLLKVAIFVNCHFLFCLGHAGAMYCRYRRPTHFGFVPVDRTYEAHNFRQTTMGGIISKRLCELTIS
uniref:Uncharacterized protein n=1 Tax=Cacopsylla melanoneura TaxID=428564 RepID=A0A8D8TTM3_9HEMI